MRGSSKKIENFLYLAIFIL